LCRIYDGIATLGILFSYFPEAHHKRLGISKWQIIKKIDIVRGFLSIGGVTSL